MGANYQIRPILVTQRHHPKSILTHMVDTDVMTVYPVCVYYIEGAKQNVIIDSGCPPSVPAGLDMEARQFRGKDAFDGGWGSDTASDCGLEQATTDSAHDALTRKASSLCMGSPWFFLYLTIV